MKCVFCKVETARKEIEYKEVGVSLGKFPANVCPKCNEAYFDSETAGKIQDKSKKAGLFGISSKAKVAKVGESYAIRIPKKIAEFIGLEKGNEVTLRPLDRKNLKIET